MAIRRQVIFHACNVQYLIRVVRTWSSVGFDAYDTYYVLYKIGQSVGLNVGQILVYIVGQIFVRFAVMKFG